MQDTGNINTQTAVALRTLLDKPQEPNALEDAQLILDFYKKEYEFVQIVRCLNCGSDLCLWILDRAQVKQNMQNLHPMGLRRIELGDQLLSTRKRYDGAIGYKCKCGANSLISEVERGYTTRSSTHIPSDAPHVKALVEKRILATNYKPNVQETEGKIISDNFFEHTVLKGVN